MVAKGNGRVPPEVQQAQQQIQAKFIALPIELINAIAQYLGARPFTEVVQMIMGLQQNSTPLDAQMQVIQPPDPGPSRPVADAG